MCANSEGSGETVRMRRLAWAFAGRLCDKYHNLMSWLIFCVTHVAHKVACSYWTIFRKTDRAVSITKWSLTHKPWSIEKNVCLMTLISKRNYSDIKNLVLFYFLQKDYFKRWKSAFKRKRTTWYWKILSRSLQSLGKIDIFQHFITRE